MARPPLEDCTVEFLPILNEPTWKRFSYRALDFTKGIFKGLYHTYLLARHAELHAPLKKSRCPMHWLWDFSSLFMAMDASSNSTMMKAILRHPRKDPEEGFFNDHINGDLFLPVFRDLFPDEKITADDFLIAAHKNAVNQYRQPILQFIGLQNIKKHGEELEKIVDGTVEAWAKKGGHEKLNATDCSFVFTTNVISRLLLGHPGPDEIYQNIATAIHCLFKCMMKMVFWRRSLSKEEKVEYDAALETMRQAIHTSLTTSERPVLGSLVDVLRKEEQMTEAQIKCTLFLMYLGGSETTGSMLSYILWQLGRHPEYQEEIYQEMQGKQGSLYEIATSLTTVDKLFAEGIRLFTPVYVIGRFAARDLKCVMKDKNGQVVFEKRISKRHGIVSLPSLAGRDPHEFEDPDTFNPHRFNGITKNYPWHPFGDGKHSCPGQWLAKAKIVLFITRLVERFHLQSSPETEPKQKGHLSLRIVEDIWLTLTPREKGGKF